MKTPKLFVRLFKPQFSSLVASGAKCQTVRPTPKRMPHIGDRISLREWVGKPYRSKQRVLKESVISGVRDVYITEESVYDGGVTGPIASHKVNEESFARADGFESFSEMREWFSNTNGLPFEGIVIKWR